MASTADSVIYDMSLQSEKLGEQFTSKNWLQITDSNNGSYNGQINIESSSLANSGRWLSYSEGLLTIPIQITLTNAGGAASLSPFFAQLKSGAWHLIDSVEVQFGNMTVQQITPFSNMLTNFKMLTSFSYSGLVKYGHLLDFWPDDYRSYRYSSAAAAFGSGVCCNGVQTALLNFGDATLDALPNAGLLQRLYAWNDPVAALASGAVSPFTDISQSQAVRKSFYQTSGNTVSLSMYAVIRLEDISDFCKKLPLTKGGFLKLTLNTNTSRTLIRGVTGPLLDLASASSVSVQGRTNPVVLCSAEANNPNASFQVAAGPGGSTSTLEVGIVRTPTGLAANTGVIDTVCRLWVPAYTMNAEYEAQYLASKPITEVVYQDAYQYTIPTQSAGSAFSQLLTNGIVDPQYLLVIPIADASLTGQTVSPILSPFSSEPATTSPCPIGQFQVQLSGKNMFQSDIVYDWLAFQGEMSKVNSLNGGMTDDLASGLIGFGEWSGCYRYYVADLSRGSEGDKYIPKSVLVAGTNVSTIPVQYYCFIVFNRTFRFRTQNSEIIM